MEYTQEIQPNFTSPKSVSAEDNLSSVIADITSRELEPVPIIENSQILDAVKRLRPDRLRLVGEKLQKEGLTFSNLSNKVLLDRLLGLDNLVRHDGKTIGFDVTSGKGTLLHNKSQKLQSLGEVYKSLGIDHTFVVKIRQQPEEPITQIFLSEIDQRINNGSMQYGQVIKIS